MTCVTAYPIAANVSSISGVLTGREESLRNLYLYNVSVLSARVAARDCATESLLASKTKRRPSTHWAPPLLHWPHRDAELAVFTQSWLCSRRCHVPLCPPVFIWDEFDGLALRRSRVDISLPTLAGERDGHVLQSKRTLSMFVRASSLVHCCS